MTKTGGSLAPAQLHLEVDEEMPLAEDARLLLGRLTRPLDDLGDARLRDGLIAL